MLIRSIFVPASRLDAKNIKYLNKKRVAKSYPFFVLLTYTLRFSRLFKL